MTTVVKYIDEHRIANKRLGRHVEHDARSRAYAFSLAGTKGTYATIDHAINIPVLDQGSIGSCTGNAAEACAGSSPFFEAIPNTVVAKPVANTLKAEQQAVALYSAATVLDNVQGKYPPTDTGSTGLAVAKAVENAGLISGYQHAFDLDASLQALAITPVVLIGMRVLTVLRRTVR